MELLFPLAFIKLFFFLTLINSFLPKGSNKLYCGIFGGGFSVPIDELIMEKLKLLGLVNMRRGTDSCGYYNGDIIEKGVGKNKEFFDFVINNGIKYNENGNNVFIGHTRNASVGYNLTEENAHPFNINDNIIIAHNGTIDNIWQLCTKYAIKQSDITVDSIALGRLLCAKNYPILEEYEGAAALLIHKLKKPNSLYIYHGWSKLKKYSVDETEERPLFYMKTPYGVYVSSLKEALDFIRSEGYDEPKIVPHNAIMEIRDGVLITKPIAKIDRSEIFKTVPVSTSVTTQFTRPYSQTNSNIGKQFTMHVNNGTAYLDISKEIIPSYRNSCANRIYFHKGRYHSDTGALLDGEFIIVRKTGAICYNTAMMETGTKIKTSYFYKGIMIDTEQNYRKILTLVDERTNPDWIKVSGMGLKVNFAQNISEYTSYPVQNLPEEVDQQFAYDKNMWYKNGHPIGKEAFTPLFCPFREYHFANGYLKKVVSKTSENAFPKTEEQKTEEFSKEVKLAAKIFDVCFSDIKHIKACIKDEAMDALEFYFEDVQKELFHLPYCEVQIQSMIQELLEEAVNTSTPVRDLLDPLMFPIEYYLTDAMGDINGDEDVEEVIKNNPIVTAEGTMGLTPEEEEEILQRTLSEKERTEKKN